MPYYSDLSTPSSSHLSFYSHGPYSNHSSIIASNYSSPYKSIIPRNFRGYKPHLNTISEGQSALRRIHSPKLLINTNPKVIVPRPRKINTSDIDVSSNKYKKQLRPTTTTTTTFTTKQEVSPNKEPFRSKSPSPRASVEEKDAKPNVNIRRDRATVRLKTIHKDTLKNDLNAIKSWRDNFEPDELNTKEKLQKKTPGEILVEKFLIRSRSRENIAKLPTKKASIKKTIPRVPSFKDICTAITSDAVDEELNPGQPMEIQRRQSRQYSSDDILKELRRNSKDLTNDDIHLLEQILDENQTVPMDNIEEKPRKQKNDKYDGRMSVRKKKITKKKSDELLIDSASDSDKPKLSPQRRLTQKKIQRTSTDSSIASTDSVDENVEKSSEEVVRDISQVEIESIKIKPKPVITATIDIEEKPTLKPVIDDVQIVESPKRKKPKMFRFNVIVEEIEEKKRSSRSRSATPTEDLKRRSRPTTPTEDAKAKSIIKRPSIKTKEVINMQLPKAKEPVISNIVPQKSNMHVGHVLDDIKEVTQDEEKSGNKLLTEVVKIYDVFNEMDKKKEVEKTELNELPNKSNKLSKSNVEISQSKLENKTNNQSKSAANIPKILQNKQELTKKLDLKELDKTDHEQKVKEKVESNCNIKVSTPKADVSKTFDLKTVKTENEEKPQENVCLPKKTNALSKNKQVSLQKSDNNILNSIKDPVLKHQQIWQTDEKVVIDDIKRRDTPNLKEEPLAIKVTSNNQSVIPEEVEDDTRTETAPETDTVLESETPVTKKIVSKRSLIYKSNKTDPDLLVFVVPQPVEEVVEEKKEPEADKDAFVPLQSNRLSQWMHPWKKPEQYEDCPIEIYARPKPIKGRHYPRPRHPAPVESGDDEESSEEESEDDTSSEEETSSDECNDTTNKIGASTSSNDSGFDSEAKGGRNKDCDVNCHKKCEKLTANLCGINQKMVVEAIESVKKDGDSNCYKKCEKPSTVYWKLDEFLMDSVEAFKRGSSESRDSPTSHQANNPAFSLDAGDCPEYTKSSTFLGFQKSGRITPPATTIPKFRKYNVDDFNFLKVLGKGSFGKVLLAELKNTEYYYAIKCLKKDVVLEDDDVECTLIERKVLALGTKHPYLCHLLCTFQTDSHLFFVMEYLNGGDLMWHIQASGRFEEDRARFYGAEIVSGLKFLHNKGIVYRDLKLDNILLDYDGHVRIADFGMCKLQIYLDRMADTFCGTPDYMAPEIIKGQHYNQCVDWWSFGVLLYEMLIGQSPFSGCDEDELFWSICNEKPVLPRFLSRNAHDVLTKFLEKDWNKRLGNRFSSHGDIQDQPFFKPLDWHDLEARKLEPPFKPCLLHPLDTQYFDKTFTIEAAKITPIEQNILQSMDQAQFQGFSYTNPNATD